MKKVSGIFLWLTGLLSLVISFFPLHVYAFDKYRKMSGKDSLVMLAELPNADMTFYELYKDNIDVDRNKAVGYAEIFLGQIDTTAVHPVIARLSKTVGDYYEHDRFLFSKAILWKKRALYNYEKFGNRPMVAILKSSLARLYYKTGQYNKTIEYASEALEYMAAALSDTKNDGSGLYEKELRRQELACYNILAAAHYMCMDKEKSDQYLRSYIEGARRYGDKINMAMALNNSAVSQEQEDDSVKIVNLISEAIEICRKENDSAMLCKFCLNLSMNYMMSSNFAKAEHYLDLSEPYLNNYEEKGRFYYLLGQLHFMQSDYSEAVESVRQAIENYSTGEFEISLQNCYSLLNSIYSAKGDTVNAYKALVAYHDLEEKLGTKEVFLELYHSQREIAERKEAEKDARRRSAFILYSVSFLAMAGIILYLIMYMKNRQKRSLEEVRSKNEILEIKKMQEFRLKQKTGSIVGKLKKLNLEIKDQDVKDRISEICSELENADSDHSDEIFRYIPEFNSAFSQKLMADFPDLTVNERRLCVLLNLNMSTKEISEITRQSPNSIKIARYRLRTKFNLTGEDKSLQDFLSKYN